MDKKDYKYILKRVITFFIIFFILFILKSCNVHAETIQVNYNKVKINDSTWFTQYGYYGMNFSTSGTSFNFELEQYDGDYTNQQYGETPEQFTMVAIDFCFGSSINKLERANNYGDSCPNSCFTQTPFHVYLGTTCKYDNTHEGFLYRLYFPILKWEAVPSTNLDLWRIKDKMKITPNAYNTTGTFTNVYLTTELPIPDSIDTINSQISSLNSTSHQDSINTQNAINNASSQAHQDAQQAHQDAQQAHQDSQDIKNAITDTSNPNNLNALSNSAGWLPPGPVDSILNLPLSLLNNLSDNLSKNCQPVVLPIPLVNSTLTLPCVKTLYEQMGVNNFINWVGVIVSAFILLSYLLKLYKWVDDTLTFRENHQIDNWGGI